MAVKEKKTVIESFTNTAALTNGSMFTVDGDTTEIIVVFTISDYTTGSFVCRLQESHNGGTDYAEIVNSGSKTAVGEYYVKFSSPIDGPFFPSLRVAITGTSTPNAVMDVDVWYN